MQAARISLLKPVLAALALLLSFAMGQTPAWAKSVPLDSCTLAATVNASSSVDTVNDANADDTWPCSSSSGKPLCCTDSRPLCCTKSCSETTSLPPSFDRTRSGPRRSEQSHLPHFPGTDHERERDSNKLRPRLPDRSASHMAHRPHNLPRMSFTSWITVSQNMTHILF